MKISGRFVRITNTKFVPDRLTIYEGEAITFKLDVTDDNLKDQNVYQVRVCRRPVYEVSILFMLGLE